jgi:hypothetical protein
MLASVVLMCADSSWSAGAARGGDGLRRESLVDSLDEL